MAKRCFYELFSRIDDGSKLASLFNKVLSELNTVRIFSAPTTFVVENEDERGMKLFYETCLWELYLHGIIDKLNRWKGIITEYESEFESNWKYYASSKRLDSLKEYGGDDTDYDSEGNIRTMNLSDKDLECYAVIGDLVQDDWKDIVQETKPEHLSGLCSALRTNAQISITDIFKQSFGKEINTYKQDKNGGMIPMTFVDKALSKASDEVQADNLSAMVLYICHCIQFIIKGIRGLNKFSDNKQELHSIYRDVECLLDMRFKDMSILNDLLNSE